MRGKKGASAAKRQAETATEAAAAERRRRERERADWTQERAELRGEINRLRGCLTSEVDSRVRAQVEAIRADAERRVQAADEARLATAWDVVHLLITNNRGFRAPFTTYRELATLLGASIGRLLDDTRDPSETEEVGNREGRRGGNTKMNIIEDVTRNSLADQGPRPDLQIKTSGGTGPGHAATWRKIREDAAANQVSPDYMSPAQAVERDREQATEAV